MKESLSRRQLGLMNELLLAMVAAIIGMVLLNAMHPPAVSTVLSFGLEAGDESNFAVLRCREESLAGTSLHENGKAIV
jgi:hypothetical protein